MNKLDSIKLKTGTLYKIIDSRECNVIYLFESQFGCAMEVSTMEIVDDVIETEKRTLSEYMEE